MDVTSKGEFGLFFSREFHVKGRNPDLDVPVKRVGSLSDSSDIQHRLCCVFDQSGCCVPPRAVPVKHAKETDSRIAADLRKREWAPSAEFVTGQPMPMISRKVLLDRGILRHFWIEALLDRHFWWHSIGNTGAEARDTLPLRARNSQKSRKHLVHPGQRMNLCRLK